MNDTTCFLHTREISCALKSFSPLQRIRRRQQTWWLTRRIGLLWRNSRLLQQHGGRVICACQWETPHGVDQNQYRNTEPLHFWLHPPQFHHPGQVDTAFQTLRPQSNNISYLMSPSLFQRNTQNPVCQIFPEESSCWITADPYTHTHTLLSVNDLCEVRRKRKHTINCRKSKYYTLSCLGIDFTFTGIQTTSVCESLLPR